ncbi:DNA replication origin binding protein [Coprinopsis cinerea AmutBmut pab1-1]|nr:DNA replication origin binding protein [Coprinopsis cinerea AmutBmut pab1-1]
MTRGLRRIESIPGIDHDDVEEDEESSESSDDGSSDEEMEITQTPSRRKGKGKATTDDDNEHNIIVQTNFDAYFTYAASRPQTSTNVYSELVLPMTPEEYAAGIKAAERRAKTLQTSIFDPKRKRELHSRFMFELQEGFNIVCYGIGSKRTFLNEFASNVCSKRGHVVIANAFQPAFTIKDLLARIEEVPGLEDFEGSAGTVDKQATRIHEFFANPAQKHHLYLIIHNIDAAPLRTTRSKAVLGLLAMNPKIHIVASIDHLNATLLWSSSEVFARKPAEASSTTAVRGFSWLWHDLTTLAPYDAELAYADRSSISGANIGARRKADLAMAQNPAAMSETAASHILASVTQKAKKLFILLGKKQLESIEDAGDKATNDLQQHGMSYDALFNAARDDFIAVNDTALRALLGEFRDHSLVLSAPTASGEVLWIPLRKERLHAVLNSLQAT